MTLGAHFLLRGLESHASLSMLRDLNGRLQLLLQYDAKVIDGWAEDVPMISYVCIIIELHIWIYIYIYSFFHNHGSVEDGYM